MAVGTLRDFVKLAAAPSATEQQKVAHTHNTIREHLESDESLKKYYVNTYLQGSYHNSTNVRGDSDVDMGCRTDNVFYHSTEFLPTEKRQQYGYIMESVKEATDREIANYGSGSFTFWDYRQDVLASLQKKYGWDNVIDGNKAIGINGNTSRLEADVLPCTQFRQYYEWNGQTKYHTGISFFSKTFQRIVNFPEQHYENLKNKDQANDGKVKGCIRIMKRLRNELEANGRWDRKRSPSYYIESLVYNVPNKEFQGGYTGVIAGVLLYLQKDLKEKRAAGKDDYGQANGVFRLFHTEFWNMNDAIDFVDILIGAAFES
jgi:hypothetical protein